MKENVLKTKSYEFALKIIILYRRLGVADQVPPDGLVRRVKRVAELVNEYGKY